jgi:hypothetical protein
MESPAPRGFFLHAALNETIQFTPRTDAYTAPQHAQDHHHRQAADDT